MRYVIWFLVMAILAMQTIAVEIDVDCDGWWDGYACQPWEIQDEVDEITDLIDENTEDIEDLQEDVQENADNIADNSDAIADNAEDIDYLNEEIQENAADIDDLQEDVEQNAEDIDDNSDAIDEVSFMSWMGDKMLRQYSDWNDRILRRYSDMKDNEMESIMKKYTDENDGHGVSFETVLKYLMTDYIDYLKDFFTTQIQADKQQEKLYELEARLNLCGCEGYTQEEYDQQYLTIKAKNTETTQCNDEMCCYASGVCLSSK